MANAEAQADKILIVDAHLDLAYNAVILGRDLNRPVSEIRQQEEQTPPPNPQAGICMVSWPELIEGNIAIVGASIFTEPARKSRPRPVPTYRTPEEARELGLQQLDYYRRVADERGDIMLLRSTADLDALVTAWESENPTVGVYVIMEGADPIRTPRELGEWVEQGLRGIGLAWAAGSRYAGGNANPGPLTTEGRELLRAMADHHLTLDLSHLWEEAALEALDRYPGPVVATHANPRALVDSPRQLTDDLIRRIADREGVIGAVAYNRMLDPEWYSDAPRPPLARLVEAIDHICQLVGHPYAAGLGSDLDGGFGQASTPLELDSIADLPKIATALFQRGYSKADVDAIMHGNWMRIMKATLEAF